MKRHCSETAKAHITSIRRYQQHSAHNIDKNAAALQAHRKKANKKHQKTPAKQETLSRQNAATQPGHRAKPHITDIRRYQQPNEHKIEETASLAALCVRSRSENLMKSRVARHRLFYYFFLLLVRIRQNATKL